MESFLVQRVVIVFDLGVRLEAQREGKDWCINFFAILIVAASVGMAYCSNELGGGSASHESWLVVEQKEVANVAHHVVCKEVVAVI